MTTLWILLFLTGLVGGWLLNLFGLPGNWWNVVLILLFWWLYPVIGTLSTGLVIAVVILAALGELLEFLASSAGIAKGGSKRGALFAIIGSIVGTVVGGIVGIPIPIIGPIAGIILFSAAGAMAGAIYGERADGKTVDQSVELGKIAFIGRVLGSVAKLIIGSVIVTVAIAALIF